MAKRQVIWGCIAVFVGSLAIYFWVVLADQRRFAAERNRPSEPLKSIQAPNGETQPATAVALHVDTQRPSVEPVAASPIVLPGQEFDRLLARKSVQIRQAKLEEEAVDPAWAPAVENYWLNYFNGKPELGVPSIQCKRTLCEARLFARGLTKEEVEQIFLRRSSAPNPAGPHAR